MWETVLQLNRCPVRLFRLYTGNRSKIMRQADSPFYLVVNWKHKDTTEWYKAQPMGIHKVNDAMKTLPKHANLAGRKTNHSARKIMWRLCVGLQISLIYV